MAMLDASSSYSNSDFLSVFFSRIGDKMKDLTPSSYDFYMGSPIIKLFLGTNGPTCVEVFKITKEYVSKKALSDIENRNFSTPEQFYKLMQLYCLTPDPPLDKFSSRATGNNIAQVILDFRQAFDEQNFVSILHHLSKYIKLTS